MELYLEKGQTISNKIQICKSSPLKLLHFVRQIPSEQTDCHLLDTWLYFVKTVLKADSKWASYEIKLIEVKQLTGSGETSWIYILNILYTIRNHNMIMYWSILILFCLLLDMGTGYIWWHGDFLGRGLSQFAVSMVTEGLYHSSPENTIYTKTWIIIQLGIAPYFYCCKHYKISRLKSVKSTLWKLNQWASLFLAVL